MPSKGLVISTLALSLCTSQRGSNVWMGLAGFTFLYIAMSKLFKYSH